MPSFSTAVSYTHLKRKERFVMNPITPAELAAYFDHTQLRAYAQRKDFEKLCAEAVSYTHLDVYKRQRRNWCSTF